MVRGLKASDLKTVNALRHEIHMRHVKGRPDNLPRPGLEQL